MTVDLDAFLAGLQARVEVAAKPVKVPRLIGGQVVYARCLLASEFDQAAAEAAVMGGQSGIARQAARMLCDEDGKRLCAVGTPIFDAVLALPWEDLQDVMIAGRAEHPGNA